MAPTMTTRVGDVVKTLGCSVASCDNSRQLGRCRPRPGPERAPVRYALLRGAPAASAVPGAAISE
jgi:hypothetical protein